MARPVAFAAGVELFHCGDPVAAVYTVRRGKVSLVWSAADKPYPIGLLGPGSIIGLPAALNGTYSVGACAAEDSELGFIPADRVVEVLQANPRLCLAAMKLVGQELARLRSTIMHIAETRAWEQAEEKPERS